ncbi:uncharacterized protein GGS22DRAFT_166226 [Annulohypoxylon maeteangense]|uniref:uncharacterized protein n=1 Tax=Annulohypoxylon maeteangense TaxID=1927788 RepID=UPI00200744F7|nr:uncharacterized protein GGS22DRAFT_166226 [Annulohypoxylon maeteangense]KAI0883845.1 hypothetical protein GGS22DRAFT_166226 [Annulohypoxylon maeteangense]
MKMSGTQYSPRPYEPTLSRPMRSAATEKSSDTTPLLPKHDLKAPVPPGITRPFDLLIIVGLFFCCAAIIAIPLTIIGAVLQTLPHWISGEEAHFSVCICLKQYFGLTAFIGAVGCVMETTTYVESAICKYLCGEGMGGVTSGPYCFPVLEVWCIALIIPWVAMRPWSLEEHVGEHERVSNQENNTEEKAVWENGDIV